MPPPIATGGARKKAAGPPRMRARADEGVPHEGGPPPVPHLLPVANDAVDSVTEDLFMAKYKVATDHAEGAQTMNTCEQFRATISAMPHRPRIPQCLEQSLLAPDHDVQDVVMRQPEGMRGVIPGATDPERLTRDVVWNDVKAHFNQPKTAPEQLADEQPTPNFVHNSAQQFQQTTGLMKDDLANRLHLSTDDFHAPLHSAGETAAPWTEQWGAGFNSLTDLGGDILGPTSECLSTFEDTVREQLRLMEQQTALIKDAATVLAQAETKKTELNDLGKKAKGDPNDPDLLELMHKHKFHEVGSVSGRIIGEKKAVGQQIRDARKALLDALEHTVGGVNTDSIETINALLPGFLTDSETVSALSKEAADRYRAKAQHMIASQQRIADKKAEFQTQDQAIDRERQAAAKHYVGKMEQWKRDSELKLQRVQELLAAIEANEKAVRVATREDQESAWKAQVLKGTLAENVRVLDACNDEIKDAPDRLYRCMQVAGEMGATGAQLICAVTDNLNKDVLRRESGGRDVDAQHVEEHCVARRSVFKEKINVEINKFKCGKALRAATDDMEDAEELEDEDAYGEADEMRAKKQDQLNRHEQTLTGLEVEIEELDELVVKVADRFHSLYTDPSLEGPGKEQRARIASTDAKALWTRASPRGIWTRVLPAYELERKVREVVGRQQDRRSRLFLERQQEAAEDEHRFNAGLAGAIGDARAAGGGHRLAGGGAAIPVVHAVEVAGAAPA